MLFIFDKVSVYHFGVALRAGARINTVADAHFGT
jgi:hypothetical protein